MSMPDHERWKQLSPLLDELLDLDAAQRHGRLAELRKLDASVAQLRRIVESQFSTNEGDVKHAR